MIEPLSSAAVALLTGYGGLQALNFLKTIAGPAASEVAELLADPVREYRAKRVARVIVSAHTEQVRSGVEPQPVHPRILLPLVEGASLEDDESLADMWAGLLATAASAEGINKVAPSFPFILRQLSPLDAAVLNYLLKQGITAEGTALAESVALRGAGLPAWGTEPGRLVDALGEPEGGVRISLAHLEGLGLLSREPAMRLVNLPGDSYITPTDSEGICLSPLGEVFALSCSASGQSVGHGGK